MLIYLIVLFMGGYILQCGVHILDSSKRLCFFSCAYYVLTYSRPGCWYIFINYGACQMVHILLVGNLYIPVCDAA